MSTKKTIWNKNFVMIFIVNIMTATSFYLLSPTLPKYVLTLQSFSAMAGMTMMIFVLASTAVRPFTGHLSDTLDLGVLLAISLAVITLAIFGYALAATVPVLMAFRVLHGFGWGLATTATGTYAAHSLPEGKMGQGIGIFGLASVVASAVGPGVGLAIVAKMGYRPLFLASAALAAAGLLLSLLLPKLRAPKAESAAPEKLALVDRIVSKKAVLPSALVLLTVCATSSIGTFIAVYGEKLGIADIGLFFTVSASAVFLARPLSGRLSDSVNKALIVLPGLILTAGSLLLIFFAKSLWLFLVAALVYGLGYGGVQPALQAWCVRDSGVEQRGRANSTFYMGMDLGTGFGSLLSGFIADRIGYQAMYLCMIAPVGMAVALFVFSESRRRRAQLLSDGCGMNNLGKGTEKQ